MCEDLERLVRPLLEPLGRNAAEDLEVDEVQHQPERGAHAHEATGPPCERCERRQRGTERGGERQVHHQADGSVDRLGIGLVGEVEDGRDVVQRGYRWQPLVVCVPHVRQEEQEAGERAANDAVGDATIEIPEEIHQVSFRRGNESTAQTRFPPGRFTGSSARVTSAEPFGPRPRSDGCS